MAFPSNSLFYRRTFYSGSLLFVLSELGYPEERNSWTFSILSIMCLHIKLIQLGIRLGLVYLAYWQRAHTV